MKDDSGEKPRIRVVDEESAAGEALRLGEREQVMRLGEQGAELIDNSEPRRLEREAGKKIEAREATVEEILDADGDLEAPEDSLEKTWGAEAKRWLAVPWGWFVLIGLICVGFAVWSLQHIHEHRGEAEEISDRAVEIFAEQRERDQLARAVYERLEGRISDYLASGTIEERLKHVRDPERVAPLMDEYYEEVPLEPDELISVDGLQILTVGKATFWMVRVKTSKMVRVLLVQQTDDDDALIDWETDVCFQPVPWERYVAERPEGAFDFRVTIRLDNYYGYEFSDESIYRGFRLTARNSETHLYGYVRRGSEVERRIVSRLRLEKRPTPMILRIEFPKGSAAKRSVLISEVISESWCLVGE